MQNIITYGIFDTRIGQIVIGRSEVGLCWLGWMTEGYKGNGLNRMKEHFPKADFVQDDAKTKPIMDAIMDAWDNDDISDITMDIHGTEFQKSVWNALLDIPKGTTCTYGDVANAIQKPKASRAVGSAVGENPISLLIPCHRVVQSTGALGNYGWGVGVKENLLKLEAENVAHSVQAA
ncbi:MAG: methylated-DNA--[protein]-cysteine S-methyltransferase [Pseudomonadota bacterium]